MKALTKLVTAAVSVSLAACNGDPGSAGEADRLATMEETSAATATTSATATTYIARSATWWYWDDGVDRETSFSDPNWQPEPGVSIATAPLGYGESYVNPISYGGDPAHKPMTAYFRKAFYVEDPGQIGSLRLDLMYDDGFVFYINGHEGGRDSLPAGPIGYATAAYRHEANGTYFSFAATGSMPYLVSGWNTLAIEIHQDSPASRALVFDAALVGAPCPHGDHAIHHGARWSYRGDGVAPAGWNQPGFDDSTWQHRAGPLGYGEAYVNTISYGKDPLHKPRAVYFRHRFHVGDPTLFGAMYADVLFDDGFVAYLNGHEVARDFMPLGPVDARTLAWSHEANAGYVPYDLTSGMPYLQAGENWLAVEVHQTSEASSDLAFDLSLLLQVR